MSSALSVAPLLLHETGGSPTRTRRQCTATYTLQILTAADACTKPGALLRREGLYSSHLAMRRAAQRRGDLQGPAKRRGPAPSPVDPSRKQIVELERALAKATARGACGAHSRRPPKVLTALGPDTATARRAHRDALMETVISHGGVVRPLRTLCTSLGVAPATSYRARRRAERPTCAVPCRSPPRALAGVEQQQILDVFHEDRFLDLVPVHV